ncbi:MAG: aminodeoxychorismate lyase [Armatimonadetes bacterium]|nr:aminodeoxychorismate lyase [Armatimonadota bacterium]
MSERYAYVSGSIVRRDEAGVAIDDRGLLFGDGLYETIRVRDGQCVRLDAHLERLRAGMETLSFGQRPEDSLIARAVESVLEANNLIDARARLTVTRGLSEGPGRTGRSSSPPTVIVTADPLPESRPSPARVIFSSIRKDEASPLCRVKSLNHLPNVYGRIEAERAGVDDGIFLNTLGNVCEGLSSNLFLVKGNSLITPSLDQGPLPGTARAAVIDLAPGLGLDVEERAVRPEELFDADEVFLTNAITLVRPVREVDGKRAGGGFDVGERVYRGIADCVR